MACLLCAKRFCPFSETSESAQDRNEAQAIQYPWEGVPGTRDLYHPNHMLLVITASLLQYRRRSFLPQFVPIRLSILDHIFISFTGIGKPSS